MEGNLPALNAGTVVTVCLGTLGRRMCSSVQPLTGCGGYLKDPQSAACSSTV